MKNLQKIKLSLLKTVDSFSNEKNSNDIEKIKYLLEEKFYLLENEKTYKKISNLIDDAKYSDAEEIIKTLPPFYSGDHPETIRYMTFMSFEMGEV